MPIKYERLPDRSPGGQHVGFSNPGVRGVHYVGDLETGLTGFEASCDFYRSLHKNQIMVQGMIKWALSSAGIKDDL